MYRKLNLHICLKERNMNMQEDLAIRTSVCSINDLKSKYPTTEDSISKLRFTYKPKLICNVCIKRF